MFKDLTPEETATFQEYARANLPGRSDWSSFHPVCRKVWWELACRHDGIDPMGSFIVFSKSNPYFQEAHSHEWANYLHTAYVLVRKPQDHHCKVCSDCGRLLCEAEDV